MPDQHPLTRRLAEVEQRIADACRENGRKQGEVTLMAVGKTRSARELRDARNAGVRCFGENYVDEALAKLDQLADLDAEWHFIGPIQSNKTRALSSRFDWVQTVDRAKIVRRLADQRPEAARPLSVLIQVNIDREPQKAGCDPDEVRALAEQIAACNTLELRGLMAIPSVERSESKRREPFANMRLLFERLKRDDPGVDTLSMGMSADLEDAIAEGSTMVRIGTALFGPRPD